MEVQSTDGKQCYIPISSFSFLIYSNFGFVKHGNILKPDGWLPDEHDLVENYGDQP